MAKKVILNLEKLQAERGNLSTRELSFVTGIRRAALSELINNKRKRIQFEHIEKIAEAFNISDINEIITIIDVEEDAE